jgi:hypothetical protein
MASMISVVRPPRILSAPPVILCLAASALVLPAGLSAQELGHLGLRGGAIIDRTGEPGYGGQVELVDLQSSRSVEVAIGYLAGTSARHYQRTAAWGRGDEYREDMRVRGAVLLANALFRRTPGARGPHVVLGMGLGPFWVDWTRESPSDTGLGMPRAGGGSAVREKRLMLGTVLNVGGGQRLGDRFDVRAQLSTLVVPSTDAREELWLVPVLVLTTGVGL